MRKTPHHAAMIAAEEMRSEFHVIAKCYSKEQLAAIIAKHISAPGVNARLVEALTVLVKMYVANLGSKQEFIACYTPPHSASMSKTERARSNVWKAWDEAREALTLAASSPPATPTLIEECEALLSDFRCRGGTGAANVIASRMASMELALEEARGANQSANQELIDACVMAIGHLSVTAPTSATLEILSRVVKRYDAAQKGQQ